MKYDDLTLDELEFLGKMREADAETRADVLAILINGRRRDTTSTSKAEVGNVVSLDDVRRMKVRRD